MDLSALSVIRFGYGVAARAPAMADADVLLADLTGEDRELRNFPRETTADRVALLQTYRSARKEAMGQTSMASDAIRTRIRRRRLEDLRVSILRPLAARIGFRERLLAFWADHFTVAARGLYIATFVTPMHDEAIRPHLTGRFADMLFAATTHPAMLLYLDQQNSVGPNAPAANGKRGLNENLAREVLELHTLGVGATYTQADVTEFAELLTGLQVRKNGTTFVERLAEPGPETVLGRVYGEDAGLETIRAALEDIAARPETARHLARKLAVHFIADTPPKDMVDAMAAAYRANDGRLMPVYEVMLGHPAAQAREMAKVKQPMEFIVSAARAIGVTPQQVSDLNRGQLRNAVVNPLTRMGQTPFSPRGPDGWPEAATAWITPAMLAARIEWAALMAEQLAGRTDPRQLLETVLPGLSSKSLRFAVAGTESGWEGVALILASPEFNRR